jgi:hypothetical protein
MIQGLKLNESILNDHEIRVSKYLRERKKKYFKRGKSSLKF